MEHGELEARPLHFAKCTDTIIGSGEVLHNRTPKLAFHLVVPGPGFLDYASSTVAVVSLNYSSLPLSHLAVPPAFRLRLSYFRTREPKAYQGPMHEEHLDQTPLFLQEYPD